MVGIRMKRSERCVRLASAAWAGTLVWFVVALFAAGAWVGPGAAFLAWSAPAAVLAGLTWRWLAALGAAPGRRAAALFLAAWATLALAAWDGGDRIVPTWSFPAFWVLLVGFPLGVTALMRRLARRAGPVTPAV